MCGHIEEGSFSDTDLDGLNWAMLRYWPGEVAEGNGTQQVIIGERADPAQREALRKIFHGESPAPGATHYFVYNSTMSTVLDTLYAPIELSIDVDARMASLTIEGLVESRGTPIISPYSGKPARTRISMPETLRRCTSESSYVTTIRINYDGHDIAWDAAWLRRSSLSAMSRNPVNYGVAVQRFHLRGSFVTVSGAGARLPRVCDRGAQIREGPQETVIMP
jgi:hypothetical protein